MSRCHLPAPKDGDIAPLYRGLVRARTALRRAVPCSALALLLATGLCGCGTLGFGGDELVTGSVRAQKVLQPEPPEGAAPRGVAQADWTEAKLALKTAFAARDADPSIPWENAATKARGTATLFGRTRDGGCRDFMISIVDKSGDKWVQGEACRSQEGIALNQVRVLSKA